MKKTKKLEWFAFRVDFNSKKPVRFNVLNDELIDSLKKKVKKTEKIDYNKFKELLSGELKYYYWSRTEYEVLVSAIHCDEETKLDVYYQLEPNLDRMCEYLIRELKLDL
jgi:CRISPR/Cas system CSM-associated protein Csm4 (group 5 of RAMP superfamily)